MIFVRNRRIFRCCRCCFYVLFSEVVVVVVVVVVVTIRASKHDTVHRREIFEIVARATAVDILFGFLLLLEHNLSSVSTRTKIRRCYYHRAIARRCWCWHEEHFSAAVVTALAARRGCLTIHGTNDAFRRLGDSHIGPKIIRVRGRFFQRHRRHN